MAKFEEEEGGQNVHLPSEQSALHIGDIVFLKCHLKEEDLFSEARDDPDTTGFLHANGIRREVTVVPLTQCREETLTDMREYLFEVVDQLKYSAQRDLARIRKNLGDVHEADDGESMVRLRTLEMRAKAEMERNNSAKAGTVRTIRYGDVIQLQHLKTRQFLAAKSKLPALLQRTSRRIELQHGSASTWLRVNPFYAHRTQGEPVLINEQVSLELTKLANRWNLNWSHCQNRSGDDVYEVNCAQRGRGFYFVLFSRASLGVGRSMVPLSFGTPVRIFHPHHDGYLSASCSTKKTGIRLRRAINQWSQLGSNSKDVWTVDRYEPMPGGERRLLWDGFSYGQSVVMLRHFGSGRYLSLNVEDLVAGGMLDQTVYNEVVNEAVSKVIGRMVRPSQMHDDSYDVGFSEDIRAELVDTPGPACMFVLEEAAVPQQPIGGVRKYMSRSRACVMVRWNNPMGVRPMWLSCAGVQKGKSRSLDLQWSLTRSSRDAFLFDIVDDNWMQKVDIVHEHVVHLRRDIIPRVDDMNDGRVARRIAEYVAVAISDMILFLGESARWRVPDERKTNGAGPDALKERLRAKEEIQMISRELKYVDATVELFNKFSKHVPSLCRTNVSASDRANVGRMLDSGGESSEAQEVTAMKLNCAKLIVRLWLFVSFQNPRNGLYFFSRGWMDTIDRLNGHGVGASDIYVAMLNGNPELVRRSDSSAGTIKKFIDFIRILGPLKTWFQFLQALCVPAGQAIGDKQQSVLEHLYFSGTLADSSKQSLARKNRAEVMIAVRLHEPFGVPLTRLPRTSACPAEQCFGRELMTHGIHDIVVSWAHPEAWEVGKAALYHGPHALGMPLAQVADDARPWVSLSQVAWVLQPDRCCPATFGVSADTVLENVTRSVSEANSQAAGWKHKELLSTLATFFLVQLQLVGCMCRNRQMNCIMALQEEYSFSLCVCGASDVRLPSSYRAAFFDLITDLWLDRFPHSELVVPLLMHSVLSTGSDEGEIPSFSLAFEPEADAWTEDHRRRLPVQVQAFYKLVSKHKMEALVQSIRQHLSAGPVIEQQVHTEHDDTMLMIAVLRSLHAMLRFGFVHSADVLDELVGPLLRCLDGRTDWLTLPQSISFDASQELPDERGESPAGSRAPLLQCETADTQNVAQHPMVGTTFPPRAHGSNRYIDCDENRLMMESKVELLRVLLDIIRVRHHVVITRVVRVFSTWAAQLPPGGAVVGDPQPPAEVVAEVVDVLCTPVLSFEKERIRDPDVMLMDLMMYDSPELRSLALQVFTSNCMPTREILQDLQEVSLLSTPEATALFAEIKGDVSLLGKLFHEFELWGVKDSFSPLSLDRGLQLSKLCSKLKLLCERGRDATTSRQVQDMLRQTEFSAYMASSVKLNLFDFDQECRFRLRVTTGHICALGAAFVKDNKRNQEIMFDLVMQDLDVLADVPESALMFVHTLEANYELCCRIHGSVVVRFADLIARERNAGSFAPWYIAFFNAIVVDKKVACPKNQSLVIQEVQRLGVSSMLHLGGGVGTGAMWLMRLAKDFRSSAQLRSLDVQNWIDRDGELVYFCRSLELLVGLACGRGSQSLVNRPFVQSLFSAEAAITMLLSVQVEDALHEEMAVALLHVRILCLELLELLLYDVSTRLVDARLLTSAEHVELFGCMLDWLRRILRLGSRDQSSSSSPSRLSDQEDRYVCAILSCVDSFFKNSYAAVCDSKAAVELVRYAKDWAAVLEPFVTVERGDASLQVALRDIVLLQSASHHAMLAVGMANHRSSHGTPIVEREVLTHADSSLHASWLMMLRAVAKDRRIEQLIENQEIDMGSKIARVAEFTHPEQPEYLKSSPSNPFSIAAFDFRRNVITTEEVLKCLVESCEGRLHDEAGILPTLRRSQQCCLAILKWARSSTDPASLPTIQATLVRAGVIRLAVLALGANLSADVTTASWSTLSEALETIDGDANHVVQQGLWEACTKTTDDMGMWESFQQAVACVEQNVKRARMLRRMPVLAAEEIKQVQEYETYLASVVKAFSALRLMVEGHYRPMQDYLYAQVGNIRSCNAIEVTSGLLVQFCREPSSADLADSKEFECMQWALTLLVELTQGPNLRNQECLSTIGFVGTAFKLLAADCEFLQRFDDDVYPSRVRRLKAHFVQTMLALLEGRLDFTIHNAILQRLDRHTLRERLMFVYVYFIFGAYGVSTGEVASDDGLRVRVPRSSAQAALLASSEDPSGLWRALAGVRDHVEELLEDFDDAEIEDMLNEGLNMLQLVYELVQSSSDFERAAMPPPTSEPPGDPSQYSTLVDFRRAEIAYHQKDIYVQAFNFFQRFVKTIEVILNDRLHNIHFRQPITAMWYVHGATKQHIKDTVPLDTPDSKAKAFLRMSLETHSESLLIRRLSRFSVLPLSLQRWAQRSLPDAAHRPFQIFFRDDARMMQRLLYASLGLSLALAFLVGGFLVHPRREKGNEETSPVFASSHARLLALTLGVLHFACTLVWLVLNLCVRLPLAVAELLQSGRSTARAIIGGIGKVLRDQMILWRLTLLLLCGVALRGHYSMFAFLVTDLFCQSSSLRTVLAGIVGPAKALTMTFIGATIITFVYAAIGFHSFRKEFGDYCKDTILTCTQNILYQGTRSGIIGISPMMSTVLTTDPTWAERMFYDMSYFIVFGIMLLNTIVALIVDSFSSQRSEAEFRLKHLVTKTFISDIDRTEIEAAAQEQGIRNGFEYHEARRQHMWDYMSFVFYLREKESEDFTGPEQVIMEMVQKADVKWMPLGCSKMLRNDEKTATVDALDRLRGQMDSILSCFDQSRAQWDGLQERLESLEHNFLDSADDMMAQMITVRNSTTQIRRSTMSFAE
eukprot:TRINITY_DN4700_c0_g8_i1.p1 TRINITY_DN4700_c0_g8~~TRINITY_DN4700_c0_g8_i1.p1  ORF type:complete len:2834 (-),score=475.17 TRINITY_DN4700_c0_g8_i1:232-8733(-)